MCGLFAHIFMLQDLAFNMRLRYNEVCTVPIWNMFQKCTFFRMAHHANLKNVSGWHVSEQHATYTLYKLLNLSWESVYWVHFHHWDRDLHKNLNPICFVMILARKVVLDSLQNEGSTTSREQEWSSGGWKMDPEIWESGIGNTYLAYEPNFSHGGTFYCYHLKKLVLPL